MEVVTLLLYVGVVWVLGALGLFAWNLIQRGHEHTERLAMLPLDDNWMDPGVPPVPHHHRKSITQEGKSSSP